MRKVWLAFVMAGLMAVWSAPASAVTLFDNGGPDGTYGYYSDPTNWDFEAYNYFTLSAPATITGIGWFGSWIANALPTDGGQFSFDIQTDSPIGTAPSGDITNGTLGNLGVSGSPVGTDSIGLNIYSYTATPAAGISLGAGTYYLSIYNSESNGGAPFVWEKSTDSAPEPEWSYKTSPTGWYVAGSEGGSPTDGLAFNLTSGGAPGGTVPEPATMTLLGLGLAGLVAKVARRKNR